MSTLSWTNDIADSLWHITAPVPAYITSVDGMLYSLAIPALDFSSSAPGLSAAQDLYVSTLQANLSEAVQINVQLIAVTPPVEGQIVAIATGDDAVLIGTWDAGNSQCVVTGMTIPIDDIVVWAPCPSFALP